jgi:hypothetical protein
MGSGHFLAAALPLMARLRMAEEKLTREDAVVAVLRDNLHGLEIDPRCAQLAGFNLALAAWKFARGLLDSGRPLPPLQLACCGQAPVGTREEWLQVLEGRGNTELRFFLGQLYDVFQQAPLLGSLIQPRRMLGGLFDPKRLDELFEVVDSALAESHPNLGDRYETGVVVQGIAKAVQLLSKTFILVSTNVPYLARGKQEEKLRDFIEEKFPAGKADLATAFVLRCMDFSASGGSISLVTPHNWLFLASYESIRKIIIENVELNFLATLGEEAWQSFCDRGPAAILVSFSNKTPSNESKFMGIDGLSHPTICGKIEALRDEDFLILSQFDQARNPNYRITVETVSSGPLLDYYATSFQGVSPADTPRFGREYWEIEFSNECFRAWITATEITKPYGARSQVIWWSDALNEAADLGVAYIRGHQAWGRSGVAVRQMRDLSATLYSGEISDTNTAVIVPEDSANVPALWAFVSSQEFQPAVRKIDKKVNVTNATFTRVPFDIDHWTSVAKGKYPNGLPEPYSPDPTQWLFKGRVDDATEPLQVAVARLLGYRWPAETDSEKAGVDVFNSDRAFWDGIAPHADVDGIVCLTPLRGEPAAAARLVSLLHRSWELGHEHPYQLPANWREEEVPDASRAIDFPSPESWIAHLISRAGARDIESYLRDVFFEEHCKTFQHRPFLWHVWDGRPDGFHALVNYHKLAAPDGAGHKLLENLTYAYLGDWIRRQKDDANNGVPGAEDRMIAAAALQQELKNILQGESYPQKNTGYDIFVRWKPLHQQAIGWHPDLNDGVRLNIRPFLLAKDVKNRGAGILRLKPNVKWGKDRGKEPIRLQKDYPWFWGWDEHSVDFKASNQYDGNRWNDCHYTIAAKQAARLQHQNTSTTI